MTFYDDDEFEDRDGEDGDGSVESHVWQLLLLINPDDEEGALQQFTAYRETVTEEGEEDPLRIVARVIDWRAGFEVEMDDTRALVEAINELIRRWSDVTIDWGGDPDDDEFHEATDGPELFAKAFDQLKERGYTLWARDTEDDLYAGWITRGTRAQEQEPMREIAANLGINLRLGNEVE